jgi:nucleotide-binding universal stress UspA family protein
VEAVNRGAAAEAERVCEHAVADARRQGVRCDVHAVPGDPADVLVVGSRGMSGARRFVLGSVPNKVSHHCPCSLLIVDTTAD